MKKNKFILTAGLLILTIFGCSKEENCTFSETTYENSTYSQIITKIDSNGIDVTNKYRQSIESNPCNLNSYNLNSNNTYIEVNVAGCSAVEETGTWSMFTSNNKNYIVVDNNTLEIDEYTCNSFTGSNSSTGGLTFTFRFERI